MKMKMNMSMQERYSILVLKIINNDYILYQTFDIENLIIRFDKMITLLTIDELLVLKSRYGLFDINDRFMSFKEVGLIINKSPSRVQQIEHKIFRKIRLFGLKQLRQDYCGEKKPIPIKKVVVDAVDIDIANLKINSIFWKKIDRDGTIAQAMKFGFDDLISIHGIGIKSILNLVSEIKRAGVDISNYKLHQELSNMN